MGQKRGFAPVYRIRSIASIFHKENLFSVFSVLSVLNTSFFFFSVSSVISVLNRSSLLRVSAVIPLSARQN